MAKQSELARKIADINAQIQRLLDIRDFLSEPAPAAPPKRERKKKAKTVKAESGDL